MIEIEHLTKRYGEHLAVSDLSFQVDSGQIYGFLGPNGAGNSTTMNIMTGCLSATEGHVPPMRFTLFLMYLLRRYRKFSAASATSLT